ncbi:MAG: hypothetical protein KDB82_04770 [Planctomycetes bacterium]|nr:hypothetical protein [Planctomycetota bacterium]
MDNLKKNLHFVVFGAGALIGIILLVAGIVVRGGKEDSLAAAQTGLAKYEKPGGVKSSGTLERDTKLAKQFGGTLEAAESALLSGRGVNFVSDFTSHNSGGEFWTNEAGAKLSELRARFANLEKPLKMPELLSEYSFTKSGGSGATFWDQLEKEMASPSKEKIRDYQMRLRVLDELATTCERLMESGADGRFGVTLLNVKFEDFAPPENTLAEAPWIVMPVGILMECAPDFAVLLASELANPTERSLGPTKKKEETDKPHQRRAFPIFVDMMQAEMKERLPEVRYDVSNEEKADLAKKVNEMVKPEDRINVPDDPKKLDPENGEGKKLVEKAGEILNEKDVIALPARVGIQFKAAAFNKDWKVVAVPADGQ